LGDVVGAGFFRTARSVDDGDFHILSPAVNWSYLFSFSCRVLCFVTIVLKNDHYLEMVKLQILI